MKCDEPNIWLRAHSRFGGCLHGRAQTRRNQVSPWERHASPSAWHTRHDDNVLSRRGLQNGCLSPRCSARVPARFRRCHPRLTVSRFILMLDRHRDRREHDFSGHQAGTRSLPFLWIVYLRHTRNQACAASTWMYHSQRTVRVAFHAWRKRKQVAHVLNHVCTSSLISLEPRASAHAWLRYRSIRDWTSSGSRAAPQGQRNLATTPAGLWNLDRRSRFNTYLESRPRPLRPVPENGAQRGA
jgi:hypothetical protein